MSADRVRTYGELPDGRPVRAVRLGGPGGIEAEVLEYGATLSSLRAPVQGAAESIETLLGFPDLQGYLNDRDYHGRVVGRVANRIAAARFELDGETYRLAASQGPNTLHGGVVGWSGRLWRLEEASAERAVFSYVSPDGEEGFPGEVRARVSFDVSGGTMDIVWEAEAGRATPVSMTHHPYFNLSGRPRAAVLDHSLQVRGSAICPVRAGLIPTGELMPVEHTPFDLRRPAVVGERLAMQHQQLVVARGFDHNWALDPEASRGLAGEEAAVLRSPDTGLELHLSTDQPGLQVYSGQMLGHPFIPHGALVLEPQGFPNAVNTPAFPSTILRPGERYRHSLRYRFVAGAPGAARG